MGTDLLNDASAPWSECVQESASDPLNLHPDTGGPADGDRSPLPSPPPVSTSPSSPALAGSFFNVGVDSVREQPVAVNSGNPPLRRQDPWSSCPEVPRR